ncbi:MAG: metallopeptidase family protein [Planctomycetota bacterium]|nr:metallopeptidase family protein [Planctomycetota bacterium]MDA1105806.1 metallopeptidase family protein [Planctomycetota bacterium]
MLPSITKEERVAFDELLEEVLASLPAALHALLEECPLAVEDHPSRAIYEEMGLDPEDDDLCGLHTGVPLTERTNQASGVVEDTLLIFRRGIIDQAGGFEPLVDDDTGEPLGGRDAVSEEIRITVLHEIGHHFGLGEDDLDRLGYA